ncbi:hypothetical protein TrST_g1900 [Triparma strigata]|uniref:Uncharacterized protein n=1 Tax=Triparma strigata TaxID=1606541 RepID=A0A9W7ETS4_9STRA|nr:hypothetical protein TrST_g1900 [Triparma strigata]
MRYRRYIRYRTQSRLPHYIFSEPPNKDPNPHNPSSNPNGSRSNPNLSNSSSTSSFPPTNPTLTHLSTLTSPSPFSLSSCTSLLPLLPTLRSRDAYTFHIILLKLHPNLLPRFLDLLVVDGGSLERYNLNMVLGFIRTFKVFEDGEKEEWEKKVKSLCRRSLKLMRKENVTESLFKSVSYNLRPGLLSSSNLLLSSPSTPPPFFLNYTRDVLSYFPPSYALPSLNFLMSGRALDLKLLNSTISNLTLTNDSLSLYVSLHRTSPYTFSGPRPSYKPLKTSYASKIHTLLTSSTPLPPLPPSTLLKTLRTTQSYTSTPISPLPLLTSLQSLPPTLNLTLQILKHSPTPPPPLLLKRLLLTPLSSLPNLLHSLYLLNSPHYSGVFDILSQRLMLREWDVKVMCDVVGDCGGVRVREGGGDYSVVGVFKEKVMEGLEGVEGEGLVRFWRGGVRCEVFRGEDVRVLLEECRRRRFGGKDFSVVVWGVGKCKGYLKEDVGRFNDGLDHICRRIVEEQDLVFNSVEAGNVIWGLAKSYEGELKWPEAVDRMLDVIEGEECSAQTIAVVLWGTERLRRGVERGRRVFERYSMINLGIKNLVVDAGMDMDMEDIDDMMVDIEFDEDDDEENVEMCD